MEKIYDMIVLGGGPAGYTAAMYAARSGLSTLVLEKLSAGGQMALTEKIDNYPGMEEGIDGFLLGEKMQKSAERFGAVTETVEVYKNNMFVKKIANLSTTTEPTAETMIDFHTYSGAIDGGRSGQLNTPMLYINGNLFFGNWTRQDANGKNYAKYFKLNASKTQLTTMNTGHTDDGF